MFDIAHAITLRKRLLGYPACDPVSLKSVLSNALAELSDRTTGSCSRITEGSAYGASVAGSTVCRGGTVDGKLLSFDSLGLSFNFGPASPSSA